jgi:hypothetical protein
VILFFETAGGGSCASGDVGCAIDDEIVRKCDVSGRFELRPKSDSLLWAEDEEAPEILCLGGAVDDNGLCGDRLFPDSVPGTSNVFDETPSWLETDLGMKVCFCEEVPGTISPAPRLPLKRRNNDDPFLGFLSSGILRWGFRGFFRNSLPTVLLASPSLIEVFWRGVTCRVISFPHDNKRCISWGCVMLCTA